MNPVVKYLAGRLLLLVAVLAPLMLTPLSLSWSIVIALLASSLLSYWVLAQWRTELALWIVERRRN